MSLSSKQQTFLKKRRQSIHLWKYVGGLLLLALSGFVTWLYLQSPLLMNPFEVQKQIVANTINEPLKETMLLILPIVSNTVFFMLFVLIILLYAAIYNERKYHEIVEELLEANASKTN